MQFDPNKYGWPWFSGTVSWVVPTAFSVLALKQAAPCCKPKSSIERIRLGREMLLDRTCPNGGWNAGNGIVFGAALNAHIDTTSIALFALTDDDHSVVRQALHWLRGVCANCWSPYSLAWSTLAFLVHKDPAAELCLARLRDSLAPKRTTFSTDTLNLAAIAINAADGGPNPFQVK